MYAEPAVNIRIFQEHKILLNSVINVRSVFVVLVGESHVLVYRLIKELQKEQKNMEIIIESILGGVPRKHSKKKND